MPNSATYKLSIKTANTSNYTLNSVVVQPRSCTPTDLAAAIANIEVESDSTSTPKLLQTVVRYVFTDFFSLAHRTGLYNRQKQLWESIARVNDVAAHRLQQGLFQRVDLPYFDLHFQDSKGRPLILACVAEPEAVLESNDLERKLKDQLKSLQQRAEKLRSSKGTLTGVFLVYPKPFPEKVLKIVEELTGASDPVGRFESILPEPLLVPIDLLEVDIVLLDRDPDYNPDSIRLVHPDLVVKGRVKN